MKKFFLSLTALCAALAISSCDKEKSFGANGEIVSTTISVGTESATKATIDGDGAAAAVKRCIVQVRMGDEVYETKTIEGTAGQKSYTTSIDLINGQSYTIIAWVDAGAEAYAFDEATANVTRVSAESAMDESLDAFFGKATLDLAATQNTQVSIIAKRPLAQINLIATDEFKAGFEPKDLVVTVTAPETFNVLTAEFDGEIEYTAKAPAAYTDKTLAMTYIFAETERSVVDVTLAATFGTEYERVLSNIPVQQNYRTNLTGKFFLMNSEIDIDVDPAWDGENDEELFSGETAAVTPDEEDEDVFIITTAAELNWIAEQVNSGATTFAGKTVKLAADIDLCNYPWTPIGNVTGYPSNTFSGIFDGQNYTIKNLKAEDKTVNHATAGLFGSLNGTIKNVNIDGFEVVSSHYAGAICGYSSASASTISNCTVKNGTILSTPESINGEFDNGDKVGGIIGYCVTGDVIDGCTIENVSITAYRDLGGIAGFASGKVINNTVKNSFINQDDTNAYKSSVTTYAAIIGRDGGATASNNVADNVQISSPTLVAMAGSKVYGSVEEAIAAAAEGETVEIAKAGTYTVPAISKNITIKGAVDGVKFNCVGSGSIASVPAGATFENVELDFGTSAYHGFQHAGTINMKDCTLNGLLFSYGNMVFDGCTFNAPASEYSMWCYGKDATYRNCTFNGSGKFLNVYCENNTETYNITLEGCTFNSTKLNKAAVNVKETCGANMLKYNVVIKDCTVGTPDFFPVASADKSGTLYVISPLVQVDDRNLSATSNIHVTLDDAVVY